MKMNELMENYRQQNCNKRMYWKLMRERLLPLLEYQEIIAESENCESIEIQKNGIVLSVSGVKLYFDFSQIVCRAEVILSKSENEDWDFIQCLVPEFGTIFDIGANVGWFSLNIHAKWPNTKIYAFEPVKTTFNNMQKNIILNNVRHGIETFNIGFYNEKDDFKFFVPPASEAASLRPITDFFYTQYGNVGKGKIGEEVREIVCHVERLDDFIEKNNIQNIDFLKCDVEGAEKMVFTGGEKLFRRYQPIVYTEMLRKHAKRFGYHPNEIILLFRKWGYECFIVEKGKIKKFEKMDAETAETNFFFFHIQKHQKIINRYK
ncbi:FkbM family methyltransferase [Pectinatus frisingensis]|uniref:FkbM family methyltransferase n=1 Tax=Pectinatus frisingensis TaxID=865 RepID=UPI0018C4BA6A|nr:FkbM family methyltransferase [Pectinatus frisingensis]